METNIRIAIKDITVEDRGGHGYYSFTYDVFVNGKRVKSNDYYEDDFSGQSGKEIRKKLKDGYALGTVMILVGEDFEVYE
jgi:hypothetical protein